MVHQFQFVPHFRPKPYKLLEKKEKEKEKRSIPSGWNKLKPHR